MSDDAIIASDYDAALDIVNLGPDQPSVFRAMPGYPWLPCPICKAEGYPRAIESCDHTVLERARVAHPGLVIPTTEKPSN